MALELVKLDSATLPGIADAIRAKTGGTELLLPSNMAAAIEAIHTGGELPELADPAAESDVLAGKEYIDDSGAKKTGTLVVCKTIQEVETTGVPGTGVQVELESTADRSSMTMTLPEPNLLEEIIVAGSSIFGVPGGAKKLRVESGTITPAEDAKTITIPCTDGAKAFCLVADDDVISAAEGQSQNAYVVSAAANFELECKVDIAANTCVCIWYKTRYANGGLVAQNSGGVSLSLDYYFYAGTYTWTAYYWEDT